MNPPPLLDLPLLVGYLRTHFALDWGGLHGAPHWARVLYNGRLLAAATGARLVVVEAFALLHDSCRENENEDPGHGSRAASLAVSINHRYLHLPPGDLDLLRRACAGHSGSSLTADITLQTCWDADRLDLGRVGIRPDPARLFTAAARDPDTLQQAYHRSRGLGAGPSLPTRHREQ